MNVKSLVERALFYLSVPKCVSCKSRLNFTDKVFCPECSVKFKENIQRNCSRCSKILSECTCTTEYLRHHKINSVIKVYRYVRRPDTEPQNKLIYSLKQDGRADVLELSASLLVRSLSASVKDINECVITAVPRRRRAKLEFGYDHAAALAKLIAKKTGAEYVPTLKSLSKRPQKSLHRDLRIKNVKFALLDTPDLKGRRVILIDDVITSGASVSAAADLIRTLQPKSIIAAALAVAYNDELTPLAYTEF
ncbi:MAG: ComF family protein [Clostridia bacterium]|nr:ComF family protein [Clostridia bacterium]